MDLDKSARPLTTLRTGFNETGSRVDPLSPITGRSFLDFINIERLARGHVIHFQSHARVPTSSLGLLGCGLAAAVAVLEGRLGEAEGRGQHTLARVRAIDVTRGRHVLLADQLLVPAD